MYVEKIPTHPEYKTTPLSEKKEIKQKLDEALKKAEVIKVKLKAKYQAEYEVYMVEKVCKKKHEVNYNNSFV